ncbi:hypothetical protein K493DRAFT_404578, partial [Basidiobolus meristosporus CBS 931.73]
MESSVQPESFEDNGVSAELKEKLQLNTGQDTLLPQETDDSNESTMQLAFPDIPDDFDQQKSPSSGSGHKARNDLVAEFDPLNNLENEKPTIQASSEDSITLPTEVSDEQSTKAKSKTAAKRRIRGESLQKSISYGGTPSSTSGMQHDKALNAPDSPENTQKTDQFEYHRFLDQIRHRSAVPVARSLKRFLASFQRKPYTVNEQIQAIHGFLNDIAYDMRNCEVWARCSEVDFENALEGMEKLIMNKLYKYTFCPLTADDVEKDDILNQKVQLYRWIKEEHLDIPVNKHNESFLGFAQAELAKINTYKAPRDKLICILNCCIVIFDILLPSHVDAEAGADKFLPILIFVVLRANPERLVSNVQYISRFRRPEKLHAESEYYLTNLMGAISFIENMDYKQLSISEEEFNRNIDKAVEEIARKQCSSEPMARSRSFDDTLRPGQSEQNHLHPQARDSVGSDIGSDFDDEYEQNHRQSANSGYLRSQVQSSPPNPSTNPAYPGALSQIQRQHNAMMQEQQYQEYSQALSTLRDMFPNIEADICELILQANQGQLQPSIE